MARASAPRHRRRPEGRARLRPRRVRETHQGAREARRPPGPGVVRADDEVHAPDRVRQRLRRAARRLGPEKPIISGRDVPAAGSPPAVAVGVGPTPPRREELARAQGRDRGGRCSALGRVLLLRARRSVGPRRVGPRAVGVGDGRRREAGRQAGGRGVGAAPRARGADRRHRRGAPAAQPRVEVGPGRGAARPLGAAVRLRDGHALQQRDTGHGNTRLVLGRAAGRRGEGLVARSSKEPGGDVGRETGFRSSGRHGVAAAELLETRQERADAAITAAERRERGHAPELRREGTPLLRAVTGGLPGAPGEVRARPGRREARAGPALQAAPVRDDAHAHVQRPPGPVSQRPRVYDDALADAPQDEKARGVEARRVRLLQSSR